MYLLTNLLVTLLPFWCGVKYCDHFVRMSVRDVVLKTGIYVVVLVLVLKDQSRLFSRPINNLSACVCCKIIILFAQVNNQDCSFFINFTKCNANLWIAMWRFRIRQNPTLFLKSEIRRIRKIQSWQIQKFCFGPTPLLFLIDGEICCCVFFAF